MPRLAPRTRILSIGAGATAAALSLSLLLSPPGDVDLFGTLGRANASAPSSSPAPAVPSVLGVEGVDLAALGYRGPDLGAVTVAALSEPFPDLPTAKAADVRDRLAAAAPQLQGLHEAKQLLAQAATEMDHHLYAAKVAASEAEAAKDQAQERLDEAIRHAARLDAPAAAGSRPAAERDAGESIRDALEVERLGVEAARARARAAAAWGELESRRAKHRSLHEAADATERETGRMDAHVRWLTDVLVGAHQQMPSAASWLVSEERENPELPIVEVRGFEVHESIADAVRQLVDHAAAAGIDLRGRGYRPIERQIELRRQNCGPSDHDVYEKPSSLCSPPTAKPGRSLHELGLALDLRNGTNAIVSRRDPAYRWLAAHAPSYGLHNLPSEPWHWSITGQ